MSYKYKDQSLTKLQCISWSELIESLIRIMQHHSTTFNLFFYILLMKTDAPVILFLAFVLAYLRQFYVWCLPENKAGNGVQTAYQSDWYFQLYDVGALLQSRVGSHWAVQEIPFFYGIQRFIIVFIMLHPVCVRIKRLSLYIITQTL
jgi:hypothetical protein